MHRHGENHQKSAHPSKQGAADTGSLFPILARHLHCNHYTAPAFLSACNGRFPRRAALTEREPDPGRMVWRYKGIKPEALRYDDRCDGIFPLILNDEKLSLEQSLNAYKHQPSIEKRHQQLKSVLEVMPVNLKSPARIEAFLFRYFLALLTEALIERALRNSMKKGRRSPRSRYIPKNAPARHPPSIASSRFSRTSAGISSCDRMTRSSTPTAISSRT